MDRRQRKSREAIFQAFTILLAEQDYPQITVQEIVDCADVGRATFYAHFETKDYLLKEYCQELFCHIFDRESDNTHQHRHVFDCEGSKFAFQHLCEHIANNDNGILKLLSSSNNDLFFRYFRNDLRSLIVQHRTLFESAKSKTVPESFWEDYLVSTFIETIKWWIAHGMKESPAEITAYFMHVVDSKA